jgi:hypothetical protein
MIPYELIQLSNIAEGDEENTDEDIVLLFALLYQLNEYLNAKIVAGKFAGC